MTHQEKQELRKNILELINQQEKTKLSDLLDVIGFVLLDVGTSALKLDVVNKQVIEKIVAEQEDNPTLAGAMVTQAVLMLGWNNPKENKDGRSMG